MLKSFLFFLCFFIPFCCFPQNEEKIERKNQVIIRLDNDAFIIGRQDKYYSGGHFLDFYHYLGEGKSFILGLGNQIYTPDLPKERPQIVIERPFAGIIYIESGFQIRKNRWFYEGKILGGIIGPQSGVGQFQSWFHNSFNLPKVYGWQNQIEDALIGNVSLQVLHSLVDLGPMEVLIAGKSKMGNLEQSISFSPSIRIGSYQPVSFSQVNGSRVGTDQQQEQYFHFGVDFKNVFFNRTLDGNSLNPDNIPDFESKGAIGEFFGELVLNYNHFGTAYGIFYRTSENVQAKDQVFARITFSWLFK